MKLAFLISMWSRVKARHPRRLTHCLLPLLGARAGRGHFNQVVIAYMVLQLICSCGWVVDQEHYDTQGKFLQIIKDIHLTAFPDHVCEIKEW